MSALGPICWLCHVLVVEFCVLASTTDVVAVVVAIIVVIVVVVTVVVVVARVSPRELPE